MTLPICTILVFVVLDTVFSTDINWVWWWAMVWRGRGYVFSRIDNLKERLKNGTCLVTPLWVYLMAFEALCIRRLLCSVFVSSYWLNNTWSSLARRISSAGISFLLHRLLIIAFLRRGIKILKLLPPYSWIKTYLLLDKNTSVSMVFCPICGV